MDQFRHETHGNYPGGVPLPPVARELGLGTYPVVGLSEARARANEAHVLIRQGKDPIEAKRALRAEAIEAEARTETV